MKWLILLALIVLAIVKRDYIKRVISEVKELSAVVKESDRLERERRNKEDEL